MKTPLFKPCVVLLILFFGVTACGPSQPTSPPEVTEQPLQTPIPSATIAPTEAPTLAPTATFTPTISPTPTQPAETADIIFYNGTLITIEESQPQVEALAVGGGLIQAVGSDEEILALRGTNSVLVDLQGKTMLPGFVEGHTHYIINSVESGKPWQEIMDTLVGFGLTSVTEMRGNRPFMETMLQAEQDGDLRVRVNVFPEYNYGFLDNGRSIIDPAWHLDHDPILDPARMLRIPGVKIFADGAGVPGRGCAYKSFPFPANITDIWPTVWDTCGSAYGDLYLTEAQLTEAIQDIQDRGYRAAFHTMGDATVDAILNALETVLAGESNSKYRHQIQHNSTLRPDQIERYAQMDILASVRGAFNVCDAEEYVGLLGEEHYEWAGNRFALADIDIHAYAEGDFGRGDPYDITRVNPLNPVRTLYGMVTHQQARADGSICEPPEWVARHPISVERALEMLTIDPAYAVSMEDYIGSLKPGKYADLIILSDNPLTVNPDDLGDLTVWMTMVGGKVEYCMPGREALCPATQTAAAPAPVTSLPTSGNLALNQLVSASHSERSGLPELAVDGNDSTAWSSGDFPPQWLEIDLGAPATVSEVHLQVTQYPDGKTTHRILMGAVNGDLVEVHRFDQNTRSGELLVFRPEKPLENVQIVRIETIASPSWVGWVEIKVIGERDEAAAVQLTTPAEGQIAFVSDRYGNPEIYMMNPDGSDVTRLTFNPAFDSLPVWSPDRTQIAFVSTRDGSWDLYLIDVGSRAITRLTQNSMTAIGRPAWSPDGTRIAFATGPAGGFDIYVLNIADGGRERLTTSTGDDANPAWSPDGLLIAYESRRDGNAEIYVMDATGGNKTNLTNHPADDDSPGWSPDGTKILFHSGRDGNGEIYIMDVDGSHQTRLTVNDMHDWGPAWSPDGKQVVFTSIRDGNWELYVVNANGSGMLRLTDNDGDDGFPDW
jgi:Tol biopolymer transport system component/predicted amidohydrolase YtcJ